MGNRGVLSWVLASYPELLIVDLILTMLVARSLLLIALEPTGLLLAGVGGDVAFGTTVVADVEDHHDEKPHHVLRRNIECVKSGDY
uniref:Uncharacterized protein n=1 Tax=Nelumbo nucifera TaxID=4432 RepID=A0A822XGD3_NELNU|nr:TPA_asm: hypothetical protein HUJ06_019358 [Nelumbo nucifera]